MAERFDRIWHNARLATMRADLPDPGEIEHGVIAARGGRIVYAVRRPIFRRMPMQPTGSIARVLDHARSRRLSHPSGLWRQPRPGIRAAPEGRELRGDRARRRRHRLDGGGDAQGKRGRAQPHALPRLYALIAEGATTVEIKSGYGLDTETEMRQLRRRAKPRPPSGRSRSAHPSSAPMRCRSRRMATGSLHRSRLQGDVAGGREGGPRRCRRCLHGGDRIFPAKTARVFETAGGLDCRSSCMPTSSRPRRRCARREIRRRYRPITSSTPTKPVSRRWQGRNGGRAAARRLLFHPRDAETAGRDVPQARRAMALATDCNPGSSPLTSLLLAMNMGATLFRMNVAECLAGSPARRARARRAQ